jgi:hypothetical protein
MPGGLKWGATVRAGWASCCGKLQRALGECERCCGAERDAQDVWAIRRVIHWRWCVGGVLFVHVVTELKDQTIHRRVPRECNRAHTKLRVQRLAQLWCGSGEWRPRRWEADLRALSKIFQHLGNSAGEDCNLRLLYDHSRGAPPFSGLEVKDALARITDRACNEAIRCIKAENPARHDLLLPAEEAADEGVATLTWREE